MRLDYFARMAYEHWKRNLPEYFNALEKSGMLEETLLKASQDFRGLVQHLLETGMKLSDADQLALPRYILLEAESRFSELVPVQEWQDWAAELESA